MKDRRAGVSRIALLWNQDDPGSKLGAQIQSASGPKQGLTIESFPIKERSELDAALLALGRNPPDALLVHSTPFLAQNRATIVAFALAQRLPTFTSSAPMARDGILASDAADFVALWHRAADFVDCILKGANPAEMPVEQPTRFELIVNLKSAHTIGLDVPRPMLLLAGEVIE